MKFKFSIEAGALNRREVRKALNNSKDKLEYAYPDATITVREDRDFLESTFYVQGVNLPDSAEHVIKEWANKIKRNIN